MKKVFTAVMVVCFCSAVVLPAEEVFREKIVGKWLMEDLYTIHADSGRPDFIESHPPKEFVTIVEFFPDGSGVLDGSRFTWDRIEDDFRWRFHGGETYVVVSRFIVPDYFLVFVSVLGAADRGAVISGLARLE